MGTMGREEESPSLHRRETLQAAEKASVMKKLQLRWSLDGVCGLQKLLRKDQVASRCLKHIPQSFDRAQGVGRVPSF